MVSPLTHLHKLRMPQKPLTRLARTAVTRWVCGCQINMQSRDMDSGGVTLIELLVVTAILVILASVATTQRFRVTSLCLPQSRSQKSPCRAT